jgi:hypothetical protein
MALIIKRTESTITTTQTPTEFAYTRLSFICDQNGIQFSVSPAYYESREDYELGNPIQNCDIPIGTQYLTFSQYPSLLEIHQQFMNFYIQLGYECEIVNVELPN